MPILYARLSYTLYRPFEITYYQKLGLGIILDKSTIMISIQHPSHQPSHITTQSKVPTAPESPSAIICRPRESAIKVEYEQAITFLSTTDINGNGPTRSPTPEVSLQNPDLVLGIYRLCSSSYLLLHHGE
jgi:hypothetical protein